MRKSEFEIYHYTEDANGDETEWTVTGIVHHGSPGGYWDPPEADDVELLRASADGIVEPFDTWAKRLALTEKQIRELEDKAVEKVTDAIAERWAGDDGCGDVDLAIDCERDERHLARMRGEG